MALVNSAGCEIIDYLDYKGFKKLNGQFFTRFVIPFPLPSGRWGRCLIAQFNSLPSTFCTEIYPEGYKDPQSLALVTSSLNKSL